MNTATDISRVRHLYAAGLCAALLVLAGDMLLGWGTNDPSAAGIPLVFTRYLHVSDGRIFASAILGLIGIPVECFCWTAVYRVIRSCSPKEAGLYRAGIIGCLAFGGCGVHVPCCAAVYLLKRLYADDPASAMDRILGWAGCFLIPASVIFLAFFFLTAVVQFRAFRGGHTPYPPRCCVFSLLFGIIWMAAMKLTGDYALTNAMATGWISIGNLWMMGGLLLFTNSPGCMTVQKEGSENDIC